MLEVKYPKKLSLFFANKHYRYKVAYGGRSSGKSWTAVQGLVKKSLESKRRILCCREFQNSIKDSVKRVIQDCIVRWGLEEYFKFTKENITCINGSEFIFKGLRNNPAEIKSMENINIAYVEEAANVSAESWELLTPTVRGGKDPEIWVVFNPNLETDYTYNKFITSPETDAKIVKINYTDNPFCPEAMNKDAENLKRKDINLYNHVWLGFPRRNTEASILQGIYEVVDFEPPDNATTRFYYGMDFGFSVDPTACIRCFVIDDILFIDHEAGGVGVEIKDTPALVRTIPDIDKWIVTADNSRPETISALNNEGMRVKGCKKGKNSIEDGIAHIRSFEKVYIHTRCKKVAEEFALYSYKVDKNGDVLPLIVDAYNHYIDALRYALEDLMREKRQRSTIIETDSGIA